ncbi:MBL fold metallo-hydrolase [Chloroflexota bacterium]
MVGGAELSHPYDCCVYLLDLGELVLIDSGAGESFDDLVRNIERLGFDARRVSTVLATHAHIDHIGSLHRFRDVFGARIAAHELDTDAIECGGKVAAEAYGIDYSPCPVDLRIQGEEAGLRFSGIELKTVHIPGHTAGSLAAYLDMDGKRVLFGQDVHGPYYPGWDADPVQARLSLSRLIGLEADILCEGHFGIYRPASAVEKCIRQYLDSL